MNTLKTMAGDYVGDYEIHSSIRIGGKEIVVAINEHAERGFKYMCGYIERTELFEYYENCMGSDDFAKVVQLFGERVVQEATSFIEQTKNLNVPLTLITKDDCIRDDYSKDINNKVIAIKPESLRPEYQRADRQLHLVIGGFGASANSRGSAVFCKNLHTGHQTRWERSDIMGEVKPECMPEWAKDKLKSLNDRNEKTKKGCKRRNLEKQITVLGQRGI